MQCWKDHQYVLGHVALARSEEYLKLPSVQRIPVVPKDKRDTIFHEYYQQTATVDPNAPPANPAVLKRRRFGTLTRALFLSGWLTCLLKDLSVASVWTFG